ncbi:hypothetical protein V6Z11_A01G039600 [Gossypium hirsutum]
MPSFSQIPHATLAFLFPLSRTLSHRPKPMIPIPPGNELLIQARRMIFSLKISFWLRLQQSRRRSTAYPRYGCCAGIRRRVGVCTGVVLAYGGLVWLLEALYGAWRLQGLRRK